MEGEVNGSGREIGGVRGADDVKQFRRYPQGSEVAGDGVTDLLGVIEGVNANVPTPIGLVSGDVNVRAEGREEEEQGRSGGDPTRVGSLVVVEPAKKKRVDALESLDPFYDVEAGVRVERRVRLNDGGAGDDDDARRGDFPLNAFRGVGRRGRGAEKKEGSEQWELTKPLRGLHAGDVTALGIGVPHSGQRSVLARRS